VPVLVSLRDFIYFIFQKNKIKSILSFHVETTPLIGKKMIDAPKIWNQKALHQFNSHKRKSTIAQKFLQNNNVVNGNDNKHLESSVVAN